MENNRPIIGTEFKVLIEIEPVDDVHMADMEFTSLFYTRLYAPLKVTKEQMIKVNNDSYIALVDTTGMKEGALRNRMTVDIPDKDFADGYRREIVDVGAGTRIYSSGRTSSTEIDDNVAVGASIKVTCRIVYYINHGEIPSYVEGEVLYTDGTVENGTLVLKKGVVNNGVLTL